MFKCNFLKGRNKNLFERTTNKVFEEASKKYFEKYFYFKQKKNARKGIDHRKKLKKMKYKDHFKIIFLSSIYFFTADYLYHVLLLKEWDHKKYNPTNNTVVEEKNKTLFSSAIWKPLLDNISLLFSKNKQQKQPFKENNKIEDPDEIRITYINKKPIYAENVEEACIEEKQENKEGHAVARRFSRRTTDFNSNQNIQNEKNKNSKNLKTQITLYKNLCNAISLNGCDLFLIANGLVFLLWRIGSVLRDERLFNFMIGNFVCSYAHLRSKYFHTILTSSISHFTVSHFIFNMWTFYTLSSVLLSPEVKEKKTNYMCFNYTSKELVKKVNDKDILKVCTISSIVSSIPYILLNKGDKLVGASGCLMGLIYMLATVKPNETFITFFPIPFITLTSLQLCHLSILINFLFLFSKNAFGIAWSAHMFGFLGGIIYNWYQRRNQNLNYYPFIELSIKNGYIDYLNSFLDMVDAIKRFKLQISLLLTSNEYQKHKIMKEIDTLQNNKIRRKKKYAKLKAKNLEEMSKPSEKEKS